MARQKIMFTTLDLIPEPLWGRSTSKMFSGRTVWKKQLRGDTLSEANNRCSICGSAEGRMICHDKWQYDDRKATATVSGFEIHCTNCDLVSHAGRALNIGYGGVMLAHLCTLTGWKPEKAVDFVNQAMAVWRVRSQKKWKIIVAPALLTKYPELAALPAFIPPPANY